MKKLLVVFAVMVCVASLAHAELGTIKIGSGDMTISGVFQSRLHHSLAEDSLAVNDYFTLNRARLILSGTIVPDKVKYFVQTEFCNAAPILDYKMIFVNLLPQTDVAVGRFLPNYSKYMPMNTGMLDFVHYPLLLDDVWGCGPWRQVGLQTTTHIENSMMWDFNIGVFNGIDQINNTTDINDAKDVMLRADMTKELSAGKFHVAGYGWLGNLLLAEDNDLATNNFGGFAEYLGERIEVGGELVMMSNEMPGDMDDWKGMGFYGQAKYMITPQWGILGRYDNVDPNTDSESKDDAWTWITFGVNHYFDSYHAMVYLNYIARMEQGDWGSDDTIKNDLIVLQFQVAP